MAPTGSRRPGYDRRARFGLFAGYVIAIVGAILALALLLIAMFDPQGFASIRGLAADATAPVSAAGREGVRAGGGVDDWIGAYWRAGSQNREMRAELDASRRRLIEAETLRRENERLRRLARLIEHEPRVVVSAQLVNSSATSARRLATLFAGSSNGVRVGQPVRSPDGLVGRIIGTGRIASRVLLVTDRANVVPVKLVRDGTPAFTTGRGDGTVDVRALEAGSSPFQRGDVLITSGTGGIYSPNIPVAVIVRVFGDSALAVPLADPSTLDFAFVQEAFEIPIDEPAAEAAPPPQAAEAAPGPAR